MGSWGFPSQCLAAGALLWCAFMGVGGSELSPVLGCVFSLAVLFPLLAGTTPQPVNGFRGLGSEFSGTLGVVTTWSICGKGLSQP